MCALSTYGCKLPIVLRFAGRSGGSCCISSGVREWQPGWPQEYRLTGDLAHSSLRRWVGTVFPFSSI